MSATGTARPAEALAGFAEVGDYVALLKPRVMSLVVFTALVGLVRAHGGVHPVVGFAALLAIAIGAGAAGALNMWWDADIDAKMARTANRPIPAGRIEPGEALAFGVALSVASVAMLGLFANWLAAGLLAFTIFFYAVIYTMGLKRFTAQNIVIGGAAGAFPPMIGWAAATASIGLESVLLFLIIFFWTPPHFWALALLRKKEYARAGVPMLPVVAGEDETRRQILVYSAVVATAGVTPALFGFAGLIYGALSAFLGVLFVALAIEVWRKRRGAAAQSAARRLFAFSVLYLFLLFAVLLVEGMRG
ncbi:MAG TPA: heme o synthase [Xanthobacteraceae bacterium]|nr:heme o synthase [Xanthobacteraceae bacterium]